MYRSCRKGEEAEPAGESSQATFQNCRASGCCVAPTSEKGSAHIYLHSYASQSPARARETPQNVSLRIELGWGDGKWGLPEPGGKG